MDKNLQKYMAFVMTVKHNSFTRAAEILNYSQSGISRMINDLEKEWGLILFERNKGRFRLTDYGAKLLPYAEAICNEYEKLRIHTDELNGLQTGLIRIGCFPSAAANLIPHILKAFRKDYPAIDYELFISEYAEIEEKYEDGIIRLTINSENNSVLIGKNGKTLQSMNELVRIALNNKFAKRFRILLDINEYKNEKYGKLIRIAKRIAKEVQQTHIKVDLDPMPSDERRIIHNTLSRYNNIKTESEGSGNKRHISISYVE